MLKKILEKIKKTLKHSAVLNIGVVAIVTLLVKGIGFTKEIIIADNLGLSELLDTFYIAILIPGFMSNVFLDGFKSVFIPNYVIELQSDKKSGSFLTTCFLVTLGVSILFCLIALFFTDIYLETFFSGHTYQYYELIKTQFYFVLPCIIFWGFTSLLNGLLNVDNEFVYSSIGSIFIPITIIICLVFFKEELGTIVLAMGTLIGSFFSFTFSILIAIKRKIIHFNVPDFASKNIKSFFGQIPAKLSANLLTGLNGIVDQYFAAQLIIGSIAALNYAIKIPMFTIGIATTALGTVLLPYFSNKAMKNRAKAFQELKKILKYSIFGSALVSLIIILLSTPIISLIFEGNAFKSSDTIVVSKIQQMYLLQVPAYIAGIIMVRFLESINKNKFMAWVAVVCLILNISLNYILIQTMGVYGLALATSIVAVLNSSILFLYINKLNKKNNINKRLKSL